MLHTSEAFYISSDLKTTVMFDYHHDIAPDIENGSYTPLVKCFMDDVKEFGKGKDFPIDLVERLDVHLIDRLLNDCEFLPEKTFFIVIHESSSYFNLVDDREFSLWGGNDTHLVFEAKKKGGIAILPINKARRLFVQADNEIKIGGARYE